jgi:hypothetical protein
MGSLRQTLVADLSGIIGDLGRTTTDLGEDNASVWRVMADLHDQEQRLQQVRMRLKEISEAALQQVLDKTTP